MVAFGKEDKKGRTAHDVGVWMEAYDDPMKAVVQAKCDSRDASWGEPGCPPTRHAPDPAVLGATGMERAERPNGIAGPLAALAGRWHGHHPDNPTDLLVANQKRQKSLG